MFERRGETRGWGNQKTKRLVITVKDALNRIYHSLTHTHSHTHTHTHTLTHTHTHTDRAGMIVNNQAHWSIF